MLQDVKWLFFDMGSTLVDEQAVYEAIFKELAEKAGKTYSEIYETALGYYKQNKKGDLETARLLGIKPGKWPIAYEKSYPDAAGCLKTLSSRYKIGIIANQPHGTKERLKNFGLLPYIDLVISSAEEGVSKPDPRIFRLALERSSCLPQHAMMIGDRIDNDILPAKTIGMHTAWVRQGFGQYWQLTSGDEKADLTVASLTELCSML